MAIVVSHIADDFDALARAAVRQAPLADLIELRLDRIGHPGEARLAALIRDAGKPVIVAVHGPESNGSFAGSVDERLEILHAAARAGAMFVDVDWTLSLELGEVEGKCHRIVSRHDLERTPKDLASFDEEVRAVLYEGDAVKLVPFARSTEDGLRILAWLRQARGGLVAFAAGDAGSFTRVLAPIFGSPFTYASAAELPGQPAPEPTAPGQLRVNDLRGLLPPQGLSAETAILAVVGRPIAQSLSPRVLGMALKSAHLDAVFVALEPADLDSLLSSAGDESFRGLAVTAPFKLQAFHAAAELDADARRTGAVNTLVRDGERWRGANTDVAAARETLERGLHVHAERTGASTTGARALVLGTGGAARAALVALADLGLARSVAGRDSDATRVLAAEHEAEAVEWTAIPAAHWDVLVHATPVGAEGTEGEGALPIPKEWIRERTLVLDAVYRPIRTPLLMAARDRGCTVVPGGEWFVRQARAQFELFTHQSADEGLLRAAFEHALGLGGDR